MKVHYCKTGVLTACGVKVYIGEDWSKYVHVRSAWTRAVNCTKCLEKRVTIARARSK